MIPQGLITYRDSEIERLAQDTLRRRPDVEFKAPINIELLVENEANVSLEVMYGLVHKHRVEGCVCKKYMSHELIVGVDQVMLAGPWPAYNAVLGEEYAHIRLHPALFLYVETAADFVGLQADPQWPRFERDARRFSAAIRMPTELVCPEAEAIYGHVVREDGFGNVVAIEKSIRNRLAEHFRVSLSDMQSRMQSWPCNLLDRIRMSIQSRSLTLIPGSWSLRAVPAPHSNTFAGKTRLQKPTGDGK